MTIDYTQYFHIVRGVIELKGVNINQIDRDINCISYYTTNYTCNISKSECSTKQAHKLYLLITYSHTSLIITLPKESKSECSIKQAHKLYLLITHSHTSLIITLPKESKSECSTKQAHKLYLLITHSHTSLIITLQTIPLNNIFTHCY
jgi:hypothetical protein